MKKIQYVGPFWKVEAEGYAFTRYIPMDVNAVAAERLLAQRSNGKPLFEDVNAKADEVEAPVANSVAS